MSRKTSRSHSDNEIWRRLVIVPFVTVVEPEAGWQEGLIKEPAGGAPISVRRCDERFINVQPDFKLRISGRDTPDSRGPSR